MSDGEPTITNDQPDVVREHVRRVYAAAAVAGQDACGANPLAESVYGDAVGADVQAALSSLGCANPWDLIDLTVGQTVLDLACGGGLDVLMAARRVGPTGRVIGVDMTAEMLALAERNRAAAGLQNVEFRRGHLEDLPVADAAVDVVISNCVVSLTPDQPRVLAEALRVLRAGGRLAVADLATRQALPAALADSLPAWAGCVAGAMLLDVWPGLLARVGFTDVRVRVVRAFGRADLDLLQASPLGQAIAGALTEADLAAADGHLVSAHITATKPAAGTEPAAVPAR